MPDAEALAKDLERVGYLADEGLATALHLSVRLGRPLLLEGEAGVGKTESARALSEALDTPLVRLQCYEGIDAGEALYEWNYARQLLEIRLAEARGEAREDVDLFAEPFLIERPLLRALRHPGPRPAVLLLDEVDRADPDFEAFLLELLADAAVSIPELGTVRAEFPPIAILTSNRTRELHDALKRRCLYHWIEYPGAERVIEIVARRVPGSGEPLARDVALAVDRIRALDVEKAPGVAEAIDWTAALGELGAERLSPGAAELSLGAAVKSPDDRAAVLGFGLERLTEHAD
ncbi:MAG: MoxR family ATPase [Proteobacteria bacterium]|nr:MoxR family ATPase [Pseudomonadota bacterium]